MDWVPLILSIIGGAAGGNLIPTIIKNLNLSPALRSIIGAIGGGGIVTAIVGLIKNAMSK